MPLLEAAVVTKQALATQHGEGVGRREQVTKWSDLGGFQSYAPMITLIKSMKPLWHSVCKIGLVLAFAESL